jgi:hypothetical protein
MAITDPSVARVLVYNVVVHWVGDAVNLPPNRIDVSRTFQGAPPAGYGFNEGRFLQMCDQITPKLSVAAGRALKLPGSWRVDPRTFWSVRSRPAARNFPYDATAETTIRALRA